MHSPTNICGRTAGFRMFDADDHDWAIGELLALFARSARSGVPPHVSDPQLFSDGWRMLNAMSFEERMRWHKRLMAIFDPSVRRAPSTHEPKSGRYAYVYARGNGGSSQPAGTQTKKGKL